MKKGGHKLLKSLVFGGVVALGLSANSTESFAAELDDTSAQIPILEQATNIGENVNTDARLQKMEDAAEVIEGDAIAETGYLKEVNESVEAGKLDAIKSEELIKSGKDVLNQAEEKAELINEAYGEITEETDRAASRFEYVAKEHGLNEYVEKCNAASDLQEKLDILDEANQVAYSEVRRLEEEKAALEEEYARLNSNECEAYARSEEAYAKYLELSEEYDEIHAAWLAFKDELEIGDDVSPELLAEYETRLNEFFLAKSELEKSNAKFNAIYYAREQAESENFEAAEEKWYSDLSNALSDRQAKKRAYDKADRRLKESGKYVAPEKRKEYEALSAKHEKAYNNMRAASEEWGEAEGHWVEIISPVYSKLYYDLPEALADAKGYYSDFGCYYNTYRDALITFSSAKEIKNRADEALENTRITYSKLSEIKVVDYKKILEDMQSAIDEISTTIDYEQAEADNQAVRDSYDKIAKATDSSADEFLKAAVENGLGDYASRIAAAATTDEKIALIDEAIAAYKDMLDSYIYENEIDSYEYRSLLNQLENAENTYYVSKMFYDEAVAAYDKQFNDHKDIYDLYQKTILREESLEAAKRKLDKRNKELQRAKGTIDEKFYNPNDDTWYEPLLKECDERIANDEAILFNSKNTLDDVMGILGEYIDANIQRAIYCNLFKKVARIDSEFYDLSTEYDCIYEELDAPYGDIRQVGYMYEGYFGNLKRSCDSKKKYLEIDRASLEDKKRQVYSYVYGEEYSKIAELLDAAKAYKEALQYNDEAKKLLAKAESLTKETEADYKLVEYSTAVSSSYETVIEGKPVVVTGTIVVFTKVAEKALSSIHDAQELCENAKDTINMVINVTISDVTGVIGTVEKNISVPA